MLSHALKNFFLARLRKGIMSKIIDRNYCTIHFGCECMIYAVLLQFDAIETHFSHPNMFICQSLM